MKHLGNIDLEKDERNQLKIDVSFTRAKLFQSVIKNLPKMFPKETLDCELVNEDNSLEIYLLIKKTTPELRKRKQDLKAKELRFLELQRFVHAKKLTSTYENAKEQLLLMINKEDMVSWTKKNDKF